jgi:hypothetical protein
MAKRLELEDIVIATITGGIFHDQDMRFIKDPGESAVRIQDLLQNLMSKHYLKHHFSLSMEDNKRVIIKQKDKERNIVTVQAGSILYRAGNQKMGQVEQPDSEITEIAALVDNILKQRNVGMGNTLGVQFVLGIPFTDKKALEVLKKQFFEGFFNKSAILQQNLKADITAFETRVKQESEDKKNMVELQLTVGDEGKMIGLSVDFQTGSAENFASYSEFAKANFTFFRKNFSSFFMPLLMEEGLDTDFLIKGEK